jgi:hypothetical protein
VANNFTAFFETLIAGAGEYNAAKVGKTALLQRVYKDVKSEAARVGKTIDVYFPDVGPMQNIGNGQLSGTPVAPNYIPLVFQNRIGKGLLFQDFEQWQTATDLAQKFFDPLYKRAREYLNGQIAALITTANFNANAPIIGGTFQEVTVPNASTAWSNLQDQKVPDDQSMLHLATHNAVYRNMLVDSAWVQENIVGIGIAQAARERGDLADAFRFNQVWDQQMPTLSGSVIYGQVQPINGSNTVTGVASAFTSDLATGQYLVFGCDGTKTQYLISAIASDTSLTLSTNYTGVTPTNAGQNSYTTARRIVNLVGTVTVTTGSATVTGSGTAFNTALTPGMWLQFSADSTATAYQVLSIGSATSLTLTTVAASTANGAGQTATAQQYTSLAFHEYAIALALRPIATPPEAQRVLDLTYIDLMGIPLRVMVSYQHIYQALFVTVDYGYALGVIRPDFGQLILT